MNKQKKNFFLNETEPGSGDLSFVKGVNPKFSFNI